MMIILISISFLSLSLFGITTSFSYHGLDNTLRSLSNTLSSSWIVTDVEGKGDEPYYDTVLVEETSLKYLKNNLSSYVNNFQVGFYYFDESTLEELTERYVTGVRVSLKAELKFSVQYKKAYSFVISHQGE